MPRIQKQEHNEQIKRYSLHELVKIQGEIKKVGSEQQWLINKGAIYLSKKPGYEGQIMVRANVDKEGITTAYLSEFNEQLKQLNDNTDENGSITIYEKSKQWE